MALALTKEAFKLRMLAFVKKANASDVEDVDASINAFFDELGSAIAEMIVNGLQLETVTPSPGSPLIISTPLMVS